MNTTKLLDLASMSLTEVFEDAYKNAGTLKDAVSYASWVATAASDAAYTNYAFSDSPGGEWL